MTGLWIAVVLLLLLALLFVVPPLLRLAPSPSADPVKLARRLYADQVGQLKRDLKAKVLDAEHCAQAIDDLKRQALDDALLAAPRHTIAARPWMGWGVAALVSIGLPAAALLVYLQVGNPMALATQALSAERAATHEAEGGDMQDVVSRLALRLRGQPDDVEGWTMLARSYEFLKRYDDAAAAYRKAIALTPGEPQLLADYADALGSARGGDLGGAAQEAIAAALAIDPAHPKALALAGMVAYRQGDLALARERWEKVIAVLPPDSEAARQIGADLAQLTAPTESADAPRAAAAGKRVGGTVSVAPALRDKVSPQDTVFVMARAAATGRMPVAILRLQAKDLPASFVLDDSLAMSPEYPLSRFDALTVEVRVSRSGQAAPQPGDLAGSVAGVAPGQEGIALQADKLLP